MRRFLENKCVEVNLDQSSKEWLAWRNKGIGSSDVALLMSPEPYFDRTTTKLWSQRVGYERAVELDNEHIRRGKNLEPIIRDLVNAKLFSHFKPVCLERTDAPYLRASLDGLDRDLGAILEIKAPSDKYFKQYLDSWTIPENYYLQMQYQMLVANVDYGYFAFYNKDILLDGGEEEHPEPYVIPVKSNVTLQLDIERRCAMFWKAVEDRIPIGWEGNSLELFPNKPTVIALLCEEDEIDKILAMKAYLPVSYDFLNKESYVLIVGREDHVIKDIPHHYRKKFVSTRPNTITKNIVKIKSAKDLNNAVLELV